MSVFSHQRVSFLWVSLTLLTPTWAKSSLVPSKVHLEPSLDSFVATDGNENHDSTFGDASGAVNHAVLPLRYESWKPMGQDIFGRKIDRDFAFEFFASHVALSPSGTTVAIDAGYCGERGVQKYQWCVFVLKFEKEWKERGDIVLGPKKRSNLVGLSLTVSDDANTLVVGNSAEVLPENNLRGSNGYNGAVFIYRWNQAQGKYSLSMDPLYGAKQSQLGCSVSISSDDKFLAISEAGNKKIHILERTGETYKTHTISQQSSESFGQFVSMSDVGIVATAGSFRHPKGKAEILVLKHANDDSWSPLGNAIYPENAVGEFCISKDGTVLAVRTFYSTERRTSVLTYAYDRDSDEWLPRGQELIGREADDSFGVSIALSKSGTTIAVGDPGIFGPGYVVLYNYDDQSDRWEEATEKPFEEDNILNALGQSVALSSDGKVLAIGGGGIDIAGGKVKVFESRID